MKRELWLDNIRWATVLLVLLYHVLYIFNSVGIYGGVGNFAEVQYQDAVLYLLYPWFMLLLFVVAGISARHSLSKRTPKEFTRSRTLKLLVPSTIGLFVFQWIVGYFSTTAAKVPLDEVPGIIKYIVYSTSGIGPLWFAQDLWLFSLILALLVRITPKQRLLRACEKAAPWMLLVISFLLTLGVSQVYADPSSAAADGLVNLYKPHYYFIGFLSGYYVFSQSKVQDQLATYCHWYGGLAGILLIGYAIIAFGQDYSAPDHLALPAVQIIAFLAVIAVIGLSKHHFDKTSKFASYMSHSSFGIYVLHYSVLVLAAYLLTGGFNCADIKLHPVLIYLGSAVAVFVLTPLLYEILRRIPILRWCILGIKN